RGVSGLAGTASNSDASRITSYQREEALERLAQGESRSTIARSFNVDRATISRLARRWASFDCCCRHAEPTRRHEAATFAMAHEIGGGGGGEGRGGGARSPRAPVRARA